jgi:hypothetical protein
VDAFLADGGSPWDESASLDVLPTDRKQFDKTSKREMHVKRACFADPDEVVSGPLHFSERESDAEFASDKQPNDDRPALPKKLAESVKLSFSILLADLPKMHRTMDH